MWSEQDLNFQPSFSSARRQLIVLFSVRECKFSARPQRTGQSLETQLAGIQQLRSRFGWVCRLGEERCTRADF